MLNINKFFRFISIRTKLLVAIIGIAITPLMFLGYYGSVLVTESLENNFLKQRKTFIISKAREIENYLNDIQNDVLYLSKSYGIQEFIKNDKSNEKKYEKFRNILINDLLFFSQNKRAYYQIRYIDNLGNELIRLNYNNENVYAVPKKELQNKIKRYYFKETIRLPRGEIYISPIDLNIEHGEIETPPKYVFRYATTVFFEKNFNSLNYKKPIKNLRQSSEQPNGIIIININANDLLNLIKETLDKNETFLLDNSGKFLYHSFIEQNKLMVNFLETRDINLEYSKDVVSKILTDSSGIVKNKDQIIAFSRIQLRLKNNKFLYSKSKDFWVLTMVVNKNSILASTKELDLIILLLTAILIIISTLIAVLSSRHITKPIIALTKGAEIISNGNFNHKIVVNTNDEIEDLAGKFNIMAKKIGESQNILEKWNKSLKVEVGLRTKELKESQELLQIENRKLDDIVSSIGAELCLIDKSYRIVWANKILLKKRNGESNLIGKHCFEVQENLSGLCPNCVCEKTFRTGKMNKEIISIKEEDGTSRYYQVVTTPVFDRFGMILNILELKLDVTNSVLQELDLEKEKAEKGKLESLIQLSSGVIHEVANPLAAMKTTLQMTIEDIKDENQKILLLGIENEIDLLNTFLKTFSLFARPKEIELQICNIRDIFKQVLILVKMDANKRGIEIYENYSKPMQNINVDFMQMQHAFLNLILNSFEVMPDGGKIYINVKFNKIENEIEKKNICITISDTGTGIDKNKINKIFEPFFSTKQSGTGLGLAIVSQIIKSHRGKISVESPTKIFDANTSFIINLPISKV